LPYLQGRIAAVTEGLEICYCALGDIVLLSLLVRTNVLFQGHINRGVAGQSARYPDVPGYNEARMNDVRNLTLPGLFDELRHTRFHFLKHIGILGIEGEVLHLVYRPA
jgi:hypothetical protein